jgi:polysaccharide export outer membrane protein
MSFTRFGVLNTKREEILWVRLYKIAILVVLLMLLFEPWPIFAQGGQGSGKEKPVSDFPEYVIQPNDLLEIVVWGEPDISRTVLVRPDGRISLPLVQDLRASELTPVELKEQMENRLEEYIDSPNVTVIVEAIQSYKVYVIGQVQNPGGIVVEKPITVLQALTLAEGFQEYANESEIRIVRTFGREHQVFEFNYKDVIKGKKAEQNIILRSGDVVVIP